MTRSTKLLIPVVLGAAAIAAFYFFALAPKRDEIAKLDSDIAAKQSQVEQSRMLVAGYEQAKGRYRENYTTMVRLGKAVPTDDDVRSLLVQLDHAAERAGVDFHALNVGGGGGTATTDTSSTSGELAPPPGAVPVGSAGFSAMPFSFGFEGSFFRLSDFFNRLEDFVTVTNKNVDVTGRLMLLGSIAITPKNDDLKHLSAQIGAATYLVPPAQGLDGATAQGPAAGEQGAAPPADGGTTPTTSATITGVR